MTWKMVLFTLVFVTLLSLYAYTKVTTTFPTTTPDQSQQSEQMDPLFPTATQFPIKTDGKNMNSSWIIIRDMDKISLHSNLEEKLSSVEAKEYFGCTSLINGGFYTKENIHIGLFVSDGKTITKETTNSLFNGFLSISESRALIGSDSPPLNNIALQTGPLLMKNGSPLPLSLVRDENARRMVAATTPQNDLVFLTLYDSSSLISGPKLKDVPFILSDIDKNSSLDFKDAINLDGGAHSAFISPEIQLTDFQTPGSYFCIKD